MKILITGSLGTLGRPLMRELRQRGHEVFGCDLRHSEDPRVFRADISERRQVDAVCGRIGRVDVVYHLAAEFGRVNGREFPEQLWRTNQIGTRNIIDLCVGSGARMLLAGSSEAYGDHLMNDDGSLSEDLLDDCVGTFHNEYALSKWAQERQVMIAAKNDGLKSVALRFFNAYGPGELYNQYRSVVCLFCYRIMFGLPITVYRDYHRVFMYIDDWCRTAANAAEQIDALPERTYNIGGTEYRSVEDMANLAIKVIKPKSTRIQFVAAEKANVTNKRPDVSLAQRDLGHDPSITLEDGLVRTVEWLRKTYDENGLLR